MAAAAAVWFSAIAAVLLAASTIAVVVVAKMTGKRNGGAAAAAAAAAEAELPLPPVVSGVSLIIPVITRGPMAVADELYVKLGSVFTVSFLGVVKATFLVGPEVQGGFYSRPESEVHQGGTYRMTVPMFGRGVMYDVDVATRSEQIAEYFAKWGEQGTVDLKRELDLLILTIASRVLLGKEVRETMFADVVASFHELMDNSMHLISLCFPNLPIPRHRRRDTASARLKELFSRAIQLRRGSGRAEDDVLQRFFESRYRDGRAMSNNEITGMLIALVVAGQHMSSSASTWTGAFLLRDPKHLAAAVDEQRRLIGDDRVDYDALTTGMSTLHRCIKEALRMHPPAPALVRTVRRGFAVRTREGKEYRMPAGHSVVSYAAFNHRLGYVYRDPDEYDPERFGPERKEDRVAGKFSFTAFGGGRHACLGEHYAFLKMKVIWSYLLRNFELELVSPFPEVELNNIMLGPRGEVMVRYKRRKLTST
uniref:Obtusifoliol 14-alpha demethylase n=1 Tax=Oryza barthii TaxID=65489 RepID=A0A0D3GSI8_9ORYZ